jgi:hypothetical protein
MRLHRQRIAMGDAAQTSPRARSTCANNAILCLLLVHVIPRRQIYVASDNPSLIPSISCLKTSCYLWNSMHAADHGFHAETFEKTTAGAFVTCTKFEAGRQLPEL